MSVLPLRVVQNDAIAWQVVLDKSLEVGATLKYYFAVPDTPNTGIYVEPSSVVGNLYEYKYAFPNAGRYFYQLKAVGTNNYTLSEGTIEVAPDLTTATDKIDLRSGSQKLLDIVNEAIAARVAGGAVKEYEIANRRLSRYSIEELLALRTQLQLEVASEKRAIALSKGLDRKIYVRFAKPYY